MSGFEVDSYVWMPDAEEMFLPAKVVKQTLYKGQAGTVKTEDGETHQLSAEITQKLEVCNPEVLDSKVDNLIKFNDLMEPAILHNLRIRFKEDNIYTYISSILISLNPFKMLPLYTPQMLDKYKEQGSRNLPPHIFAVGDNAYKAMLADDKSQSCVISGESGAGKTEATKLILQYLTEISGRSEAEAGTEDLEGKVLGCNPILEAFGNSKTLRNNNSSRFGKLISIKVRVVKQMQGERNYHIFYQLLSCDDQLKSSLKITEAVDYSYLNQTGVTSIEGFSDEKEMEDMLNAMSVMGIDEPTRHKVFRGVSGVMHCGNLVFLEDVKATEEDGSKIKEDGSLEKAAEMLGADVAELQKALTSRKIGFDCVVAYNCLQAADARDALTKCIFEKLFNYLVTLVNKALDFGSGSDADLLAKINQINVLDIFGFETFDTNSFEQLCINYCNEKLQSHFNEHIFKLEQEEYEREGIQVEKADFADNKPCLELLEADRSGIFDMLDDEIYVPRGSDDGFLNKVLQIKHPNLKKPRPKAKDALKCFNVLHFAGMVSYNVTNFLQKNKDNLHEDIQAVFASENAAADSIVVQLMKPKASSSEGKGGGKRRGSMKNRQPTLGTQFKRELSELIHTLNQTSPHFVRTMKPNPQKKGDIFQATMILDQLRYAGLLDVCRIRQQGYPIRKDFEGFFRRYKCLTDDAGGAKDFTELCGKLEAKGVLGKGMWAKGKNKVFLKNQQSMDLEGARELRLLGNVQSLQTEIRARLVRLQHVKVKAVLEQLGTAMSTRASEKVEALINEISASRLPNGGAHLSVVREARRLLVRLDEERRVVKMLEEAISGRDVNDLEAALAAADGMDPPLEADIVKQAKSMVETFKRTKQLRDDLQSAMINRDAAKMRELLALPEMQELGKSELEQEMTQVTELLKRMEDEEKTIKGLKEAMEQSDDKAAQMTKIAGCLMELTNLGMEDQPLYAEAKTKKERLAQEVSCETSIQEACNKRDIDMLQDALEQAKTIGLANAIVKEGQGQIAKMEDEAKVCEKLQAAIDSGDMKELTKALKEADKASLAVSSGSSYRTYSAAMDLMNNMKEQEQCRKDLKEAVKKNDKNLLAKALGTASKLGLSGPEVEAASAASTQLGASSVLVEAIASGDLEALEKAIAKVEADGMGDSEEAQQARDAKERLLQEREVVDKLKQGVEDKNAQLLKHGVGMAMGMGLSQKYKAEVAAAKAVIEELGFETKLSLQLQTAIKTDDMERIDDLLNQAEQKKVATDEVLAAHTFKKVSNQLEMAVQSADVAALEQAIKQADTACEDLDDKWGKLVHYKLRDKVKQAESASNKEALKGTLMQAVEGEDFLALRQALQMVISVNLSGPEVDAAKAKHDEMAKNDDSKQLLESTIKTMEIKLQSALGVEDGVWNPLDAAIQKAEKMGLGEEDTTMRKALKLLSDMQRQFAVREALGDALEVKDYKRIKGLLKEAGELLMSIEIVDQAREVFRDLYEERQTARAKGELDDDDDDDDELEESILVQQAADPRYQFGHYPNIRGVDEFTKGARVSPRELKTMKEGMLKWQKTPVHKSLLRLGSNAVMNKTAIAIHKSILGYMGDKPMAFPAALAQDLLATATNTCRFNDGMSKDSELIVDEIYLQLMKQLTENPKPESTARGWQLLCMCVGCFPPTRAFESYLLNFVLSHKEGAGGTVGNYAAFTLRRLEGTLGNAAAYTGFIPDEDDIKAYQERPPILATIELVDGMPVAEELPVTPDMDAEAVTTICKSFLSLEDERSADFGIFVVDLEERSEMPKTPRPLRDSDFLGDVFASKARAGEPYKYVFKRKLYMKHDDTEPMGTDDEMYSRLIYLQALDDVIRGTIPLKKESDVVLLMATAIGVDFMQDFPADIGGLLESEMMEYIPVPWRHKKSDQKWAEAILSKRAMVMAMDPEELQIKFVDALKTNDLFFAHVFFTTKLYSPILLPNRVVAVFHCDGLYLLDAQFNKLKSFGYADLYRWGGSTSQFTLTIWNQETQSTFELLLKTTQASDMAAILVDYIDKIMGD